MTENTPPCHSDAVPEKKQQEFYGRTSWMTQAWTELIQHELQTPALFVKLISNDRLRFEENTLLPEYVFN